MTRYCEHLGFPPKEVFFSTFDVIVVKTTLDWTGSALERDQLLGGEPPVEVD